MPTLLEQVGGQPLINRTVSEFYHAIGKHLQSDDSSEHHKQSNRQALFLVHALSEQPEPVYSARASFLARGLNPALFDALLEYLEARLPELGFSVPFSESLVRAAGNLYADSDAPLAIAC